MTVSKEELKTIFGQLSQIHCEEGARSVIRCAERAGLGEEDLLECQDVAHAMDQIGFYSNIGAEYEVIDHTHNEIAKMKTNAQVQAKRDTKRAMLEELINQNYDAYFGPPGVRNEALVAQIDAGFADLAQEDGGMDLTDVPESMTQAPAGPDKPVINEVRRKELETMMEDPRYSDLSQRDEEFVRTVEEGFQRLHEGGS